MTWEWIFIALPWAFVLVCPLAMFWMMRGMHGGGSCDKSTGAPGEGAQAAAVSVRSERAQEIEDLKERLAVLEAEKRGARSWS